MNGPTFSFVSTERASHAVATLCRVVGASVSGFYGWLLYGKSPVEVSPPYPIGNGIKTFYGVKASGILYRLE